MLNCGGSGFGGHLLDSGGSGLDFGGHYFVVLMSKMPPARFGGLDICFNGFDFEATKKTWLIIILCGRSFSEFPSC